MSKIIKVFDPISGEALTSDHPTTQIVDAYRWFKIKSGEFADICGEIREWLRPHFEEVLAEGEEEFFNLKILRGKRLFNEELFRKTATKKEQAEYDKLQESIDKIEDKYKRVGKPTLTLKKI